MQANGEVRELTARLDQTMSALSMLVFVLSMCSGFCLVVRPYAFSMYWRTGSRSTVDNLSRRELGTAKQEVARMGVLCGMEEIGVK